MNRRFRFAAVAIVVMASPLSAVAGELAPQWATLSSATARLYYQGHVRSDELLFAAAATMKQLQRDSDPEVRKTAEEVFPLLAGMPALERARDNAGLDPRTQTKRRDGFVLQGLLNPGGVHAGFGQLMADQGKSATEFARAQSQLQKLQFQRLDVWRQRVRPAVEAAAGPAVEGPPPVDVQFGLLSRDLWVSLRNTGKQPLHSCTLETITHQKKSPDQLGVWFVPEIGSGETVYMEPYHGYGAPIPGKEFETQKRNYGVDFSLWSDELRVERWQAKSVDGFTIRDPFMAGLISAGREYVTTDEQPLRLRFTQFRRGGAGAGRVQAILETPDGKKTTYSGEWTEDRKSPQSFHPAVLILKLREGRSVNKNARSSTMRWQDGSFTSSGLFGSGGVFLPVAGEPAGIR